jgi:hypothetical protein
METRGSLPSILYYLLRNVKTSWARVSDGGKETNTEHLWEIIWECIHLEEWWVDGSVMPINCENMRLNELAKVRIKFQVLVLGV